MLSQILRKLKACFKSRDFDFWRGRKDFKTGVYTATAVLEDFKIFSTKPGGKRPLLKQALRKSLPVFFLAVTVLASTFSPAYCGSTAASCDFILIEADHSRSWANELRDLDSSIDFLRSLVGDSVSGVEVNIQRAIVALDAALSLGDTDQAKRVVIEMNLFNRSLAPRTLSIRTLWFMVEYAQLRMITAELRLRLLADLQNTMPEHSARMESVRSEELEVLGEQLEIFGTYFKEYIRLRRHLESIVKNDAMEDCRHGECRRVAQWFEHEVGSRDDRMRSLVRTEDLQFKAKLQKLGVIEAVDLPDYFNEVVRATVPPNLDESRREAETTFYTTAIPSVSAGLLATLQQKQFDEFSGYNALEHPQLTSRWLDPRVQVWALEHENKIQIKHLFKRMFGNPLAVKVIFGWFERLNPSIPRDLIDSRLGNWFFSRTKIYELSNRYGYNVTRIYRNRTISIEQKILSLRNLNARGVDVGLNVFELIARRADLLPFWVEIVTKVQEGMKNDKDILYYSDLVPVIEKLEALRRENKLVPISVIDNPSPIDYFWKILTYLGIASGAAYYGFQLF